MKRVVVICEDHTLDREILVPVVKAIFTELGHRCRVDVAQNPRFQGVGQALKTGELKKVFEFNKMADAFFLIVDRDGKSNRQKQVEDRVSKAGGLGVTLFGCLAIEEAETWALALHRKELGVDWEKVRSDPDVKEVYFDPFIRQKNWQTALGKGRKNAMQSLRNKWSSLKSLCPEIQQLVDDVRNWLQTQN